MKNSRFSETQIVSILGEAYIAIGFAKLPASNNVRGCLLCMMAVLHSLPFVRQKHSIQKKTHHTY